MTIPRALVRAVAKYERRIYVHADCPPTKKAECAEDISAAQAEVARLAVEFVKEAKGGKAKSETWEDTVMSGKRCRACSFQPTSLNDYCAKHRPKTTQPRRKR